MNRYCCLHGFGGAGRVFDRLRQHLPHAKVLAPDLAGHGSVPGSTTFEQEVERIIDLLARHADGEQAWQLVGYSMGGRLSLGIALRVLELQADSTDCPRIERMTLIGANPGLAGNAERSERRSADESWARRIEQDGVETFFAAWRELPLFATQSSLDPALLAEQEAINLSHDKRQLAASMRSLSLGRMPNYTTRLEQLAQTNGIDSRWVAGAFDPKFSALGRSAAKASGGRFVALDGVGHNAVLEAPEQLAKLISASSRH